MFINRIVLCMMMCLSMSAYAQTTNTLSDEEEKDGWQLLFDGTTLNGWHTYNQNYRSNDWEVNDGAIHLADRSKPKNGSGDLTTNEDFGDFDLKLEWKISANGNSGVMFYVQEDPSNYQPPFLSGLEMQVLDNTGTSPNAKNPKQRAGDLYDLIAGSEESVKPTGEWNQIEIYSRDGTLKLYQNGKNIITTQLWDANWTKFLADYNASTKWTPRPQLGLFRLGKIDLQNADDEVWFRNIKIKRFNKDVPSSTNITTNNNSVSVPDYTSPRMKAIATYYGYLNTAYGDVSKQLEPLVSTGDKMATMWKAVFLYMGRGEYKHDENEAFALAKNEVSFIEERAATGDAEALYLLFYACQMGLKGDAGISSGYTFLRRAATAGFTPAVYDEALEAFKIKDYTSAADYFQKLYNDGVKKSAVMMGILYQNGYGLNEDVDTAINWYERGMAFGDAEALLCRADLYSAGYNNSPPDAVKALKLANLAAAKNDGDAMLFLGVRYVDGKQGVVKNVATGIKWLKQAADIGNRKAMLVLGETYFSDDAGALKDEHTGLFWIRKAAEAGSPNAMLLLAKFYIDGTVIEKDEIAARYWYNQCVIGGYAEADATAANATAQSFSDFCNNADFTPSYVLVDEYGNQVGDSGDGFANFMLGGVFGAMRGYYGNQQRLIDGLEFICKKGGNKIYGGTVSSYFASNLYLKQGQTIHVKSYGIISTGLFSGMANANGLGSSWQEYAFVQGIPCSAVMAQVKDATWQFIGQDKLFTAVKDGAFVVALNGKDYRNYKGYFDIVVEVPDN